jgi:cytochrome d ubiquinol oxidase subunit II
MLELCAALIIAAALNVYVLTGGADYGGGVWDLAATGSRAERQRELIAGAIGPIWEANHVWLILVIVVLFTAFPPVFAAISTSLHIPVTLLLIGIVLRGSSFVFRTYGNETGSARRNWGRVFAVSSLITPIWIGVIVGASASGRVLFAPRSAWDNFVRPWLAPFPFAVGFFALSLFAFLAAVYLSVEAQDQLREDFRRRALIAGAAVAVMAFIVFVLSEEGAPGIWDRLAGSWWSWPLQLATAIAAAGAWYGIWIRRFELARGCAVLQVSFIVWGWALSQYPYMVPPSLTVANAAAPPHTLQLLIGAVGAGALLLLPSFYYLLHVFKGRNFSGRI